MSYYKKSLHSHEDVQTTLLTNANAKLDTIATNTANININVSDVEINTQQLEDLQTINNTKTTSIDTRLDNSIGAVNNSANLGEGSSQLRAVSLGYDRTGGKARSILVDSGGITQTHDSVLETSANSILAKNTEIETLITQLDVVADASLVKHTNNETLLTAISADGDAVQTLLTTIDGVLDASLVKQTNNETLLTAISADGDAIQTKLDTLETSANSILAKNTEIETLITQLDVVADASLVKHTNNETLLTAISADGDAIQTKLDTLETSANAIQVAVDGIEGLLGTTNSGLSSIDAGISDLDTLLGDIQSDNNSKSDHLSGNLDTLNGKIDTLTTRIKLANSDAHLAVSLEDIGGAATQTTLAAAEAHLGNIETSVQLLDNALDGNYLNVNQNIAGTDVSSNSGNKDAQTQRVVLATDDIPTGLTHAILNSVNGSIGTGNTALASIKTAVEVLDNCVSGNEMQCDIVSSALPSGAATETTLAAAEAHLGNIDAGVDVLEACVGSNKVNVNISSGTVTANLSATDNAVLDAIAADGDAIQTKLDTLETSANAIQAAVEGTLTVGSHAVTNAGTFAVQSTIAAALPSGNNNIGNVDIASAIPAGTSRIGMVGMKANEAADGTGTERFVLCDAAGHLQVDVLSGGGSTDVSGLSTHAKQDTIIGHLDGVEGKLDAIETTNNACQVLLGTIDADTNAIKTAVEILDNAIDGNEMQVDIVSSALPSGAATQTTLASVLAKNTEIETTADAILAKNTEMETSLDAILAKNTQLETLLTSISPRTATGTLSAATNLADGAALAIVDTDGYRYMTIFGKATNDVDLHIQYSLTNSAGAMISLYNESPYKLQSVSSINNIITFNTTIEHMARYVRFINFSGLQINALTLYYQLSN